MQEIIERLEMVDTQFAEISAEVTETSIAYYQAQNKYDLIKARVQMMESVINLPNQTQRDAQVQQYLLERPEFKKYLDDLNDKKDANKRAWSKYNVLEQRMKNLRAILNNFTYGKAVNNNAS
jgi:hypothetical protein